jgi:4'-phosphopantetheinyl transferase
MLNRLWVKPTSLADLALKKNEVHVWLVQANDKSLSLEACAALLSAPERDRAERFKFESDRRRYMIAHGALRSIFSIYLNHPAAELQFEAGPNDKPKLASPDARKRLEFNLSHSHEVTLIAVTQAREVGVDVEWVKEDFAFHEVAERFFTAREVTALNSLPRNLQRKAFYKCWTSKEAFLKAKGTGLSGEFDEVEISCTPEKGVRVNGTIPNWTLVELNPPSGYMGALALEGPECQLRCFRWRQLANDLTHRHS